MTSSRCAALAAWFLVSCTLDRGGDAELAARPPGAGGATVAAVVSSVASTTSTAASGAGGMRCYSEVHHPDASLTDVASGYQGVDWLAAMLVSLERRYPNGWYLLDAMKGDPWLIGTFPSFFDLGTFAGMMASVDTACHEETHGYDFDKALSLPDAHLYYMGPELEIQVPKLGFFPRSEIHALVTQGGSVTSLYDQTYLTGTQGSYDFVFLADELTAYINGLACATSVGDHIRGGHSYRDGAAAHLYYLQAYLAVARTQHATLYGTWRGDAAWQEFVRYSWARGHFWTEASMIHPALGIDDAAIWQRINEPHNLEEIELFTGEHPDVVACTP